jgi:hypothetical protein
MPIQMQKWITRQDLRNNPDTLYVFGDNLARNGFGGQAKVMRGEPNAVGIPTKISPYIYARDDTLPYFAREMGAEFFKLQTHLWAGQGKIVWPEDGIGTGLAELESRAPKVWRLLQDLQEELFEFAKTR